MSLKLYWNLITGKSKAKKPAKFTLRNMLAVLQAWYRKGRQVAGFDLPTHTYEQIIWRRTVLNPLCWSADECVSCGCEILGKTMEDRACGEGCYPEMMDANSWKEYKNKHNIKLFD